MKIKKYMDKTYKLALAISFLSYTASFYLTLVFFGWKAALILVLFALGLSGIIIWYILLPEIYKNIDEIDKLKKRKQKR